ncbi:MAG: hypothetical protein ACYDA4_04205 [Ignavibacteriaceae bacterium]
MKRILFCLFSILALSSFLLAQDIFGGLSTQTKTTEVLIASRAGSSENESTSRYLMENDIGTYWYWPSAEHFSNSIGYSFVTIHGFISNNTNDIGVYRALGLGFTTVHGNTAITLFGHVRLTLLVIDVGYSFSSSDLKGFYYSLGYGVPIILDQNTFIMIDVGIAYVGSPTLFLRVGLLL